MSDMQLRRTDIDLQRRMRKQEAKALGPTLAEELAQYQAIHRLRGLWHMTSITETPTVIDASGQGRALSFNGTANISVYDDLIAYIALNGTTGFLSRATEAGLNITGTLTAGGWVRVGAGAAIGAIISKYGSVVANRSYLTRYTGSNTFQARVGDGVGDTTVTSTVAVVADTWYHVVMRFLPSQELAIFVNGVKTVNTTSIPAAIVSGAANLEIGRLNSVNGQYLLGDLGRQFVSAAALTDTMIVYLFNRGRVLYGV